MKIWEPSDLDSTLAGQRETLPLSPIDQQHHLHLLISPGDEREESHLTSVRNILRLVQKRQMLEWCNQCTKQVQGGKLCPDIAYVKTTGQNENGDLARIVTIKVLGTKNLYHFACSILRDLRYMSKKKMLRRPGKPRNK